MPAPLSSILSAVWVVCIAGAVVIFLLSIGWTGWTTFAIAGVAGIVVGIPAGIWSARKIKREDPAWPPDESRGANPHPPRS